MLKNVIALLLISINVFGQTSNKADSANSTSLMVGWNKFDKPDFSVMYPSNWDLDTSGAMGTSFVLFSPIESSTDKFKENVNMMIQDLTGKKIDLNKYSIISEDQIKTLVTNSNLIESIRMKDEHGEYHKIIYSGDQGSFHLQYEQFYFIKNEKAYIITLTCQKEKFAEYKLTGEKILKSFKLKK